MKTHTNQDEAYQLFEPLKATLKAFQLFRTDEYLLEQLYEVTRLLVTDYPNQKVKFMAEEKARQIWRLATSQKIKDIAGTK